MKIWIRIVLFATVWTGLSALAADDFPPQPPVPALSPADELKTIQLPPGYRLELVLSEPDIKEPVVCAFDGNGRMFVAEMRSYMQEIDGKNEHTPVSRVSLHWSSRNDGTFDRHTVFIDKLVLPRMILPLRDGLLVGETDTSDLYFYRDTDGDGVADRKELWYAGGARGGNLEHQPSGLIWAMDNWLYTTYNAYRLRLRGTNVLKEPTAPNSGQWGLTQDDFGKPWFVDAGGERGPLNFQQPIVYGAFNVRDQFSTDFPEVYPLVPIPDVQGGTPRFRPQEKTLNHFTATCGQAIFRGDRLPAELRGDLLFGEPVGRLIRRSKVQVRDGVTYLRNAHEKSEFIRATDPNFRPINMVTAPDGTLFIVDMYRGIIQEGNWVREGSYLRKVVQQYGLDRNAGRGRIWRLVHQDFKPGPAPRLNDATPAQLVGALDHPNGWWRDTAQKLLVLRGDNSVVPALERRARSGTTLLGRLHALWTLEGLEALTPGLVRELFHDGQPQVRAAAVRVSESLHKAGDKSLVPDLLALAGDGDPQVVIQTLMTAHLLKLPDSEKLIAAVIATNRALGVREIGTQIIAPPAPAFAQEYTAAEKKLLARGEVIYQELCFACHGPDGRGMPLEGRPGATQAPPLAGSKTVLGHRDGLINVVLKGLTGPVNGKTYEALMVPMESNDDEYIAAAASYVRNRFGNHAPLITTQEVARVRAAMQGRGDPWTLEELKAVVPQPLASRPAWKLSASHGTNSVRAAIDGSSDTRFDTGTPQVPGMWFQIELPQEVTVAGLKLDTLKSPGDYPRGYKVELSQDGRTWGPPVAVGKGTGPSTEIIFDPAPATFIRITQTGSVGGLFWSIHELEVWEPARVKNVAGAPRKPNPFD